MIYCPVSSGGSVAYEYIEDTKLKSLSVKRRRHICVVCKKKIGIAERDP